MSVKFFLNDKKVSKAKAKEAAGAERLERMIVEAREGFIEDPLEIQSWMVQGGFLTIEFI